MKSIIQKVICENTVIGNNVFNVGEEDNLLEMGIDSLQMMRVIVELERELDFEFRDEDLLMNNFNNILSIYQCISEIKSINA